jgi:hypothetical protein
MRFEEFISHPRYEAIMTTLISGLDLKYEDMQIIKDFSNEDIQKFLTHVDVFTRDANNAETSSLVVMSIINIRERFMRQFMLFTMSAFLHQACHEYETYENAGKLEHEKNPEVLKIKKDIILEFLTRVINNNDAMASMYEPNPADETRELLPSKVPKALTGYNSIDNADNVIDSNLLTVPPEVVDFIPDIEPSPAPLKVGEIYVPVPTRDFYYMWASYERHNYDELKKHFKNLVRTPDGTDNVFRIYDVFQNNTMGQFHAKALQEKKSEETGLSVIIADVNKWVLLENVKANRLNTKYGNVNSLVNDIISCGIDDTKCAENLLKTRIKLKQKNQAVINAKRGIERSINSQLKTISDYQKNYAQTPAQQLSEEMRQELDEFEKQIREKKIDPSTVYENVDSEGIPLNAKALRIVSFNNGKGIDKEIYIEAEKAPN